MLLSPLHVTDNIEKTNKILNYLKIRALCYLTLIIWIYCITKISAFEFQILKLRLLLIYVFYLFYTFHHLLTSLTLYTYLLLLLYFKSRVWAIDYNKEAHFSDSKQVRRVSVYLESAIKVLIWNRQKKIKIA